ncbi:MAG: hypothetical protein KKG00_11505, partial [Bacteroidetes bacterium]|nr:hypothetical protein [Bacteroidota bacterium]
ADLVVLLRLDRRQEVLKVPLKLWKRQAFEEASNAAYLVHGIVVGMLLFIIVFNIFLWISVRDPIHFYYCLYVLGLGLFSLADKGYGYQYLWPESPFLNHLARNFLALYNCAIQIHFMQLFVGQTAVNSQYYRLNNAVKVFLLVLAVVPFLSPGAYFPTYVITTYTVLAGAGMLASIVLVLASLYERYRQGSRLALYYAGALGTLLFTLFLVLLSRVFPLPVNGNDLLTYGGLAELLVLAFGLTVKYNLYKKEKENLLLALNHNQQETASRVIQAQENERERIARDLHDELGASLSILKSNLLRERREGPSVELVDALSDTIRAISHDLTPPGFERFGLAKILRSSVDSLGASGEFCASYYQSGAEVRMQKDRELMVYRVASELLHNVIKHARATELTVQLLYQPDHLVLQVEDNGVGMATTASADGLGMESIHSRAQFLRANVTMDSNALGTTFYLEIPYQ